MNDFFKYVECAVTVCDTECVIVYQNEKSVAVNGDMRGKCMLGCHNDRSRGIIARILSEGATNSYTISKKGQRKLIHASSSCPSSSLKRCLTTTEDNPAAQVLTGPAARSGTHQIYKSLQYKTLLSQRVLLGHTETP